MRRYLLDSNVFIEAKNRYYSFEICPGFWSWMDHVVAAGEVLSIEMVRDELLTGNDELAEWIEGRKKASWFLKQDDAVTQGHFARIATGVQAGPYTTAAKNEFLSGADPWLVAKAKVIGAAVVTLEVAEPASKKRVPLPNICADENVGFVSTFDLLEKLEAEFHFNPKASPKKKSAKPASKRSK